ncbi:MAG TPA: 16S rRNA (adenine(1518)-N(6)/adenine(1519)-N(6))-dimethyltransferase RsmA [Gemmatimonadaceae bacterium]|nr:16S rRNA (adenine(1518)-N(6)/adenine(1519)-N(6))-dimethyltransferase RsmA [Gemmatimonadaceae bacterium]
MPTRGRPGASGADGDGRALPPVRKSLGQHFLHDTRVLDRIVDALQLSGGETVLEIGPGRGALTDRLVERCRRLVIIEYDRALAKMLRERYAGRPSVEVVEGDVLTTNLAAAAGGPYVLAGNVPYYITTPILFHALEPPRPARAVYLVQREVADRLTAAPGSRAYGALSVNVQALARAEFVAAVPAGAFRPPPKVESAIVRITPLDRPAVAPEDEARFHALVQQLFGMRRKQMRRIVRAVASLDAGAADAVLHRAGIEPEVRPETLAPAAFARLLAALRATPGS